MKIRPEHPDFTGWGQARYFVADLIEELIEQRRVVLPYVLRFVLALLALGVLAYHGYGYAAGFALPVWVCIELVLIVHQDCVKAKEWGREMERRHERERKWE